jgi:DNA-binding MarR family transcriptional regulator
MARGAEGDPLEDHVGVRLRHAYQHAVANLTARIGPLGCSPLEFSVLVRLHDSGPWTQNHLGRSILMQPANVGALLKRLEERGLVTRTPDPEDRRAIRVAITDAGVELLARVRGEADAANRDTLAVLEPEEREQLMALLARLVMVITNEEPREESR